MSVTYMDIMLRVGREEDVSTLETVSMKDEGVSRGGPQGMDH